MCTQHNKQPTCAFVTYNALGKDRDIPDGWTTGANGQRALVLQNTKGEGVRSRGVQIGRDERIEQSSLLWEKLVEALPELDRVVVYLGANGSQRAVELAAEKADPKKVTFVSCGCGLLQKELLLEETGLTDVGRVLCECGGHLTMEKLYKDFMAQGTLPTGIPSGE